MEISPTVKTNSLEAMLRRKIEAIEDSEIESVNKLSLVLLLLKNKKGALVGPNKIPMKNGKMQVTKEMLTESDNIHRLISHLGLFFRDTQSLNLSGMSYLVSEDQKILNELVMAYKNKDDKNLGRLFGYPENSIKAFHTTDQMHWDDPSLDEQTKREVIELKPFLKFEGSRSHYIEDLEYARKNKELIQKHASKLFEELYAQYA